MTPVERLEAAGLCKSSSLSDDDKSRLNKLSDEEVQQMIRLHEKLGPASNEGARPAFPI